MGLSAEQIYKHIDKFIPIYDNGREVNPIPEDRKVTVWCNRPGERGFVCNTTALDLGIAAFIAKSWIYEDELQKIVKESK